MDEELSRLFDGMPDDSYRERFDYHVLTFVLNAGEGEGLTVKVECKGQDEDDCACNEMCHIQDLIKSAGWSDVLRAAGDIVLGKVSARMDWADAEEPWIEVEP